MQPLPLNFTLRGVGRPIVRALSAPRHGRDCPTPAKEFAHDPPHPVAQRRHHRRRGLRRRHARHCAEGAFSPLGKGEGQVDIVAWPGYIERGATDKNFDWVTDFEKKTGCKVNVKTAGTSDEMVALMNEGGFDLVTASGDASTRLIRGKKLQPINVNLIPSYKNIDPAAAEGALALREQHPLRRAVPVGLERADVQHQGLQATSRRPRWNVVFEEQTLPDGKSNKGRVQAFDGPIYIADAALYLMKKNPALGIKDPYELNEAQYKAALELLRGQRKIVGKYWHDAFVQIDDFTNEGVVASGSWQFQANILGSKKQPIATVVPVEGATGWADSDHDARRRQEPELRLHVARAFAQPQVAG